MLPRSITASQLPVVDGGGLPRRMHPIAMDAYQRYYKGKRGFSKDDLEGLRESLVKLANEPMVMWSAISGLGLLAVLLEQEGDAEGSQELRKLIASGGQHLAPIAEQVGKALGVEPAEPADQRRRGGEKLYMADVEAKRAAFHDAPAPPNSLPLFAVDYAMVSARFREVRLVQSAAWRARFPGL